MSIENSCAEIAVMHNSITHDKNVFILLKRLVIKFKIKEKIALISKRDVNAFNSTQKRVTFILL
jgi:hypothetical protein